MKKNQKEFNFFDHLLFHFFLYIYQKSTCSKMSLFHTHKLEFNMIWNYLDCELINLGNVLKLIMK